MIAEPRIGRAQLHEHEESKRHDRRGEQADDGRRPPGVLGTAPGRRQGQAGGAERHEQAAQVVNLGLAAAAHLGDGPGGQRDDDDRDRDVYVEHPPPGEVVGEYPAEQRPDHRGDAEDRAERALVLTAQPQRDDVGDQRGGRHGERAAAQALQRAEPDQRFHVAGQAAEERADDEHEHADLKHPLAAEQVAELPRQHGRHRFGQHVRGDHPAHVPGAAQVPDDGRQRRGHDRLVKRGQQHAEHDGDEHDVHLSTGQLKTACCRRRLAGLCRHDLANTASPES